MKLRSFVPLFAALFTAAALSSLFAQEVPTIRALTEPWPEIDKVGDIEIVHVQKEVYMLVGAKAHVTVQIGKEGVLIVDSGGMGTEADKIVAAIHHLTRKPFRYLINTNAQPDHAGGNAKIVDAAGGAIGLNGRPGQPPNLGILTIAHDNAVNRLIAGTPVFPALKGEALPASSFSGARKDFYANGEAVQLFYEPAAITDSDLIVFLRGSDVVSTGEIYRPDSYPVIDPENGGTIQGELNALNMILDIAIPERNQMGGTRIVPAHGRLCNEADVLEYRDMLTIIRDRVRKMVREGKSLNDVKASHPTMEYDGIYGKKEMTGDKFITLVYNDLKKNAQ